MPEPSVMMFDEGFDWRIRYRFISECFKMNSYVYTKKGLYQKLKRQTLMLL